MNIFVLHSDPHAIARHYCDIHLRKMMVEHVQLLCSAMPEDIAPYKRTHYNHPCSKWVRASASNWEWLNSLTWSMGHEYFNRFGKRHKSSITRESISSWNPFEHLPYIGLTPWAMAMPDEYKLGYYDGDECDLVIASYRRYYAAKLRDFRNRGLM
jgi:hypothetical protein